MQGTKILSLGLALVSLSFAEFSACKFNFGKGWTAGTSLSGMDFATIYAGDGGFNEYHHAVFIQETKNANVTPMFYGYIAAFMAREEGGLKDCDQGTPNLCQNGANYIRSNRARIIDRYALYSQKVAAVWGSNALVIWLIEPDLYQYSVSGSNQRKLANGQEQSGGGIPDADIAKFFKDIATKIRQYMPKAQVGVDLSPWISNPIGYYGNFDMSIIDYAFTSGGRTQAATSKIRDADKMTWSSAYNATGKPILADCGYGIGGVKDGHHSEWDNITNINARWANKVISINQFDARTDWATSVLKTLRPQAPNTCPAGNLTTPKFRRDTNSPIATYFKGTVEIRNVNAGSKIELLDAHGQSIWVQHSPESALQIKNTSLKPGLYFLKVSHKMRDHSLKIAVLD